jgi:lantibiotic leader peptide-processing serine protease
MPPQIRAVALLSAIALAACSTDVIAPEKATAVLSPRTSAIVAQSGRYIVLMKGNGIPKDFEARVKTLGGTVAYSHAGAGIAVVAGLSDASASALAASGFGDVQRDVEVSVAPMAQMSADASDVSHPSIGSQTNPAGAGRYNFQWNMKLIMADSAWKAGKFGSSSVTVAILDTGIDYNAPDLNGLVDLSRSKSFMNHFVGNLDNPNTPEDEYDPIVPSDDEIVGFFPGRNLITDLNGHGTNVASQVSSKAAATAGVTSKTTLIGVKVLGANGVGDFSDILNGVLWAADHGADVANMSLGGAFSKPGNGQFLSIINRVFNYAKQKGMLIVVAAGNSGEDLQHNGNEYVTFCDAPHVICVSAVGLPTWDGNPDTPAFYTNYGRSQVSVAAPGGNAVLNPDGTVKPSTGWPWIQPPATTSNASFVWSYCAKQSLVILKDEDDVHGDLFLTSCINGNRLNGYIGTSQASPHVAGLAALLIAEKGKGQPEQIKNIIENSADPIGPLFGSGRINVKNALGL